MTPKTGSTRGPIGSGLTVWERQRLPYWTPFMREEDDEEVLVPWHRGFDRLGVTENGQVFGGEEHLGRFVCALRSSGEPSRRSGSSLAILCSRTDSSDRVQRDSSASDSTLHDFLLFVGPRPPAARPTPAAPGGAGTKRRSAVSACGRQAEVVLRCKKKDAGLGPLGGNQELARRAGCDGAVLCCW